MSDNARVGSAGTLSLVDGASFVVSAPNGDLHPDESHGLFVRDTRFVSMLVVEVNDRPLTLVSSVPRGPFSVSVVTRAHHSLHPHHADPPVTILRHRSVGPGLHDRLELRNHSIHPVRLALGVTVDADFASLFDVKAGVQDPEVRALTNMVDGRLHLRSAAAGTIAAQLGSDVVFDPEPDRLEGNHAVWDVELGPGDGRTFDVVVAPQLGEIDGDTALAAPHQDPTERVLRVARNTTDGARFRSTDRRLERAAAQSLDDLAILRIFDPAHADRVVVAAGAPWFMALFGRDSILTAWMTLIADHELAAGVLLALADAQGSKVVAATEEQPGRILHEVRYDRRSVTLLEGSNVYYGTVDATPLFVMLVAEYLRWSNDWALVEGLLPAVDSALGWIDEFGDRDGDGFVEYQRNRETGLANQGWKDSWDGVRYGDGRIAEAPIALGEVQAYVYGAYRARAYLADVAGDQVTSDRWTGRAVALQDAFDAAFWLDGPGTYAIGLDAGKQPIDSVASNVGHCLWAGIIPEHRAARVAETLTSPSMAPGWGLRTLAADNPGFNPLSYHCGSVWPHDTAIAIAGLQSYGFDAEAELLRSALLDAADAFGGRLPELFAGFDRSELPSPVAYPASCSPQAWAAAAPLLLVRTMLRLEPDLPRGRVGLGDALAPGTSGLRAERVPIGQARVMVAADEAGIELSGLGPDVTVERS